MTLTVPAAPTLYGSQTPTFLWMPPHGETFGPEVTDHARSHGLLLDQWQDDACNNTCALTERGNDWACFENALVVSRQNGKDVWIEALELAWLYLFDDELVTHSAHLFETSREHFLRIQATITNYDDLRRRVRRMREGRGSEEIELIPAPGKSIGPRLKFMTRKGGAGRGFTGNHVVLNEAMYLDLDMMAAALPALASIPNAQVLYAGSAGMRHSTQLAYVRRRALAGDDLALMYAEWAAEPAVYGPDGELLEGDDPASPVTHAKVNPAYNIRIMPAYVAKEMNALGGPRSTQFGTERLGIGDWPEEDSAWEVFTEEGWLARMDPLSQIKAGSPIALAIDVDPQRAVGTIGVCGLRLDGRDHVEIVERHRGTGWIAPALGGISASDPEVSERDAAIVARVAELIAKHRIGWVVVLKTAAAASLISALIRAKLPVKSPSEVEYAQACGDFFESVMETGSAVHLGQQSVTESAKHAGKRTTPEGSWRWERGAQAGGVVCGTLALWGRRNMPAVPKSKIW